MSRNVYLGRSGSGKTTLMVNHLLKQFSRPAKKKYQLSIISPSAPFQPQYRQLKRLTNKYYDHFDEKVASEVYRGITKNALSKRHKVPVVVFDDLGDDSFFHSAKKNNPVNRAIVGALHYPAHFMFVHQTMTQAPPSVRKNADRIYLFNLESVNDKKDAWKTWAGDIPEEQFNRMADEAWENPYGYLKIDRSDVTNKKYFINKKQYHETPPDWGKK